MSASGDRRKPSLDMRKERASNVRATPRWGEMGGPNREATELLASRIPQVLLALGNRSVHRGLPSAERARSRRCRKLLAGRGGRRGGRGPADHHAGEPGGRGRPRQLAGVVPPL